MTAKQNTGKENTQLFRRFLHWFVRDFLGIFREMRWSYLPPLMVYLAAGVSALSFRLSRC